MSYADQIFIANCKDILSNGDELVGLNSRIRKFGIVNRYDVSTEFPFVSLFPIDYDLALKEMLWIWKSKCGIIAELPKELRNKWTHLSGTVRKQYRENLSFKHEVKDVNTEDVLDLFGRGTAVEVAYSDDFAVGVDDLLCDETHGRFIVDTITGKSYMSSFDKLLFDLRYGTLPCTRLLKLCDIDALDFAMPETSVYAATFGVNDGRLDLAVNQLYQDMASNANWSVVIE